MDRLSLLRLVWTRVLPGVLGAAGVAAAVACDGADRSAADAGSIRTIPARPPFNPWVDDAGRFHSPVWDDRNLSAEQKAADPVFNPQWEPFAACLEAEGVTVRADTAALFTQDDMDALFERLNIENPDVAANKRMDMGEDRDGMTGVFLACAVEHLG